MAKLKCPDCTKEFTHPSHLITHVKFKHGVSGTKGAAEIKRASTKRYQLSESKKLRDIGPLPKVIDPARREACSKSLLLHLQTYHPENYSWPLSQVHLKVIQKAQDIVLTGSTMGICLPRGYGKTQLCQYAAEWAIFNGYRKFVLLVAATEPLSKAIIEELQTEWATSDILLEDYPEAVWPLRCLDRQKSKTAGQLLDGKPTYLKFTAESTQFAAIPNAPCSQGVVVVKPITSRIRGIKSQFVWWVGDDIKSKTIRPDMALIDDPQDDVSAFSPDQCTKRLQRITSAILQAKGRKATMACLMPMTIITQGDMADQLSDRIRFPQWLVERYKHMISAPKNTDWWDQYFVIRDTDLSNDLVRTPNARKFYADNRAIADEGSDFTWDCAYDESKFESVCEEAMVMKHYEPNMFAAEHQNEPLLEGESDKRIIPELIEKKVVPRKRGIVPEDVVRLTAFVDVHKNIHFWMVVGWTEEMDGRVIDYNVFPDQKRPTFKVGDIQHTFKKEFKNISDDGKLVYAGLEAVVGDLATRRWKRADGTELGLDRGLVDSGDQKYTGLIYEFLIKNNYFSRNDDTKLFYPSKGVGIGPTHTPMREWTGPLKKWAKDKRQGGRFNRGHVHWVLSHANQLFNFDTNYWKSFVCDQILSPLGGGGSMEFPTGCGFFFFEQLSSELCEVVTHEGSGRKVAMWRKKNSAVENHWWDCLVGCAAAASFAGGVIDQSVTVTRTTSDGGVETYDAVESEARHIQRARSHKKKRFNAGKQAALWANRG